MNTIVAQMTTQELREMIDAIIEHHLTRLLENFEVSRAVKDRDRDQSSAKLATTQTLKPLPVFPGSIPSHWKEAIYHETE